MSNLSPVGTPLDDTKSFGLNASGLNSVRELSFSNIISRLLNPVKPQESMDFILLNDNAKRLRLFQL